MENQFSFKPVTVTFDNETEENKSFTPVDGAVWIRVGDKETGVDVQIKQSDDGLGLIISAFDAKTCELELNDMIVFYDDLEPSEL